MKHTDIGSLYKTCIYKHCYETALHTTGDHNVEAPALPEHYIITGTFRGYAENEPVLYTIADNLMLISTFYYVATLTIGHTKN